MVIEGGQIGLDEGGILKALSKGGGTQVHEEFVYNKKGLLIDKTTTTLEVTAVHVVAALAGAGLIIYGPELLAWLRNIMDVDSGPVVEQFRDAFDPFGWLHKK
ncbi:unnamed protein product [marine sediment metagenome]|uniref:Uncharacterized protein n=1 Tax=marine sediment metagenome TaxID=412755 RepID=X1B5G1_9ZZZZ